jgi:hypothetical protein
VQASPVKTPLHAASPGAPPERTPSPSLPADPTDLEKLLSESARKQAEMSGKVASLERQCAELAARLAETERRSDIKVRRRRGCAAGGCAGRWPSATVWASCADGR